MNVRQIDPGKFSRRISIERETQVPDGCGGFETGLEHVLECWADVAPVAAAPLYASGISQAETTHHVTIRYRDEVRTGMRIMFRGRQFEIAAIVNPFEANHYLILLARERA